MVLETGCVIDGKICVSQWKIMKTVIALEKKFMYFIMKILLIEKKKTPLPERILSLHCMYAVLPIAHDGPFQTKYVGRPRVGFCPTNKHIHHTVLIYLKVHFLRY